MGAIRGYDRWVSKTVVPMIALALVFLVSPTVSTVGHGDRSPVTVAGRLVATGLMLVGIALALWPE